MIKEIHFIDKGEGISLRDSVYNELKKAILSGEFMPGERLMEIHLANKLGVSRTPIREAIKRLEKEQLVITERGCGARVAAMTDKDVNDALDVRLVIENMAVRLAAQNASDKYIDKLRKYNEDIQKAFDEENYAEVSTLDNLMHREICNMADNHVLMSVMVLLEDQVLRYRTEYIKNIPNPEEIINEHKALIDAIAAGNENEAVKLVTAHIIKQQNTIRDIIAAKK